MPAESSSLGYLCGHLPGLGGRIKDRPEDFIVEEAPLYQPAGSGEHLYLWIEKRDTSGEQLLRHLARALGISQSDIGMAGLKDRRAITRQFVSVPGKAAERLPAVETDQIRVLHSALHGNKLRTGHLAANRFEILIRDVNPEAISRLPEWTAALAERGFPNAYGDQRFGRDNETLQLGLDLLTGARRERDIPAQRRRFLLRLALSSVQSHLFNQVLAERLADGLLHRALTGDVMQVTRSGGCFVVEDPEAEQRRFDLRETVVTGPMFGPKMLTPREAPAAREARVLERSGLSLSQFERFAKLLPGARRPLLMFPEELSANVETEGVRVTFRLPPGVYATTLLRELMQSELLEGR